MRRRYFGRWYRPSLWALTLYHALEMSAPMDVAVRGGVFSEAMGGRMAMAGMPAGAGRSLGP